MAHIPGKSEAIPERVDEGSLATSANAGIPAGVVRPGLEMVIEVDPDGTLDSALGVAKRIPGTGRLAVDVRTVPPLELTVVPFLWATAPDSSILGVAGGLAADPEDHELLARARALLPVGTLDVTAHEPVLSSSNSTRRLLEETEAIRVMEGGSGHYMGTMAGPVTGARRGGVRPRPGELLGPPAGHHRARTRPQHESPSRAVRRRGRSRPLVPPTRTDRSGPGGYDFAARRAGAPHDPGPDVVLRPPRRDQRLPFRQRAPATGCSTSERRRRRPSPPRRRRSSCGAGPGPPARRS